MLVIRNVQMIVKNGVYGPADVRGTAVMMYDVEANQCAVTVEFKIDGQPDMVWVLDRELLIRGSNDTDGYGEGDVRLQYLGAGTNRNALTLRGEEGAATIVLNNEQLMAFLSRTTELVPVGQEDMSVEVDGLIEEIFNS